MKGFAGRGDKTHRTKRQPDDTGTDLLLPRARGGAGSRPGPAPLTCGRLPTRRPQPRGWRSSKQSSATRAGAPRPVPRITRDASRRARPSARAQAAKRVPSQGSLECGRRACLPGWETSRVLLSALYRHDSDAFPWKRGSVMKSSQRPKVLFYEEKVGKHDK